MKYEIFPKNDFIPNQLFLTPAGAFLTIGLVLGIINAIRKVDDK
jgi:Na+-translocating ferredoxin:NAD+ oxidoreductase RnfE subunit